MFEIHRTGLPISRLIKVSMTMTAPHTRIERLTAHDVDSSSGDGNCIYLLCGPCRCPVRVFQALEKQVEVVVSVRSQNSGDVKGRNEVGNPHREGPFGTVPGDALGVRPAMPIEAHSGHGSMVSAEPECSGVWQLWVVGDHEEAGETNGQSHDAVDNKEPAVVG